MKKQKQSKKVQKSQFFILAKRWREPLYVLAAVAVGFVYLNTANNHFYHRLHTAGLVWPQNQPNYTVGDASVANLSYVALGDSLTTGVGASSFESTYSYLTAQKIVKPGQSITVTPLSTPGFKSQDIVDMYLDKAVELQPDIVTVLIGVNDVHGLEPSIGKFRVTYETILNRLKNETNADVYAVAIPTIGTNDLVWPPFAQYYSSRTQAFNSNIRDLANKYNIKYVDLYAGTMPYAAKNSSYYSKDEFHPSAEGYAVWAEVIARGINN